VDAGGHDSDHGDGGDVDKHVQQQTRLLALYYIAKFNNKFFSPDRAEQVAHVAFSSKS
jgi:hypothetical protein